MFDDWSFGASDYGGYDGSSLSDYASTDYGNYGNLADYSGTASTIGDYGGGGGYDFTPEAGGIIDAAAQNYTDAGVDYGGILSQTEPVGMSNPYERLVNSNPFGTASTGSLGENIPKSELGMSLGNTSSGGKGITEIVGGAASGSKEDSSWTKSLGKLFTTKDGDIDLKKVVTAVQGLGGLYQAYARGKDNPNANKTLTPAQLQATLPSQNNSQWTPQQQIWANKFFNESIPGVAEGNRRTVRAGEGGIKSIIPSQGYAEGGSVDTDINALLRQLYEQQDDGVIPTVKLLGLPEQGARIRIHGGDMAEGGEVVDPAMESGPLSHGNFGLVSGAGDGQSDTVPINVSPGEYVFDAETVSMLGNGSNDAGADVLDKWREFLREHKRGAASDEIGPETEDPNSYLPEGAE